MKQSCLEHAAAVCVCVCLCMQEKTMLRAKTSSSLLLSLTAFLIPVLFRNYFPSNVQLGFVSSLLRFS